MQRLIIESSLVLFRIMDVANMQFFLIGQLDKYTISFKNQSEAKVHFMAQAPQKSKIERNHCKGPFVSRNVDNLEYIFLKVIHRLQKWINE